MRRNETHVAPSTVPYLRPNSIANKMNSLDNQLTRSPNTATYPSHGPAQCATYPSQRQASPQAPRRPSACPSQCLPQAAGSHTAGLCSDSFDTFATLSARSKRYAASGVDGKADKAGVVCVKLENRNEHHDQDKPPPVREPRDVVPGLKRVGPRWPASPGGIFEGYLASATAAFSPPGAL